ncbi:MAG: hypothetical protein HQM06_01575 [Magnetococcales bacterium]|nr:hypothetical protein [Magnetococcales bacterium]
MKKTIRPAYRLLAALVAVLGMVVMARLQMKGALPLLAGILFSAVAAGMLLRFSASSLFNRVRRPLFTLTAKPVAVVAEAAEARVEHMHFAVPATSVGEMKAVATSA